MIMTLIYNTNDWYDMTLTRSILKGGGTFRTAIELIQNVLNWFRWSPIIWTCHKLSLHLLHPNRWNTTSGHIFIIYSFFVALRGFEFKETACYYKDLIASDESYERMNCFPFVEEHEVMDWSIHEPLITRQICEKYFINCYHIVLSDWLIWLGINGLVTANFAPSGITSSPPERVRARGANYSAYQNMPLT